MTDQTPVKRKPGRPKGSSTRGRLKPTEFKALNDMGNSFAESAYKYLNAPAGSVIKAVTKMDELMAHSFKMAISGDKTSHQYAKLIFERAIPQRKQVEHLGEADAQRLGVNINVITEKVNESITIEHEPEVRSELSGPELLGDGKTH